MENRYGNIEELLKRFFKGETTNAEERQLYDFFAQDEMQEALRPYKEMFGYFGQEIVKEESDGLKRKIGEEISFSKVRKGQMWSVGVAASLLLIFSIHFATRERYDGPIVGGYIIRNGVCIADMKVIRSELEESYKKTLSYIEEARAIETAAREQGRTLREMITENPYHRLLNQIPEEEIKAELKRVINGIDSEI
jgi:hypothetical protein